VINQENIEKLFDCFDKSASAMYQVNRTTYLEGLIKTCENILAAEVDEENQELNQTLTKILKSVLDLEFNKEEIRKAFQYACLKGLKHINISNQMITPDSIGVFFAYLIEKVYEKNDLVIIDPLVGTGNLIVSLANNLKKNLLLIGVDYEKISCQLSRALFEITDYGDSVYCQDIMTFKNVTADVVITDFSLLEQAKIYDIIKHMSGLLIDDGFMISVIDNHFFDDTSITDFITSVKSSWHFFGMIVLPDVMFRAQKKSIFILQKIGKSFIKPKKFLLADLPGFDDEYKMTEVINNINKWFENIDFYKVR